MNLTLRPLATLLLLPFLGLPLAVSSVGCSSSTPSADSDAAADGINCDEAKASFASCGGDILGDWTIVKTCNNPVLTSPRPVGLQGCNQAIIVESERNYSGSVTFNEEKAVFSTVPTTRDVWEIPKSCIDKDPAKQLCENLKFSGSVRKCVDKDATTCTCEDTVPDESAELGYITIEKSLNLEKESGDFCVAADGKSAVIRSSRTKALMLLSKK
ncbi:MAG: hypothetical protein KBF88_11150 [Polyangiaceae bacterium]|nr:hypothetical protein [Polyangiaceae bacterium]